jgi:hypothetical protein
MPTTIYGDAGQTTLFPQIVGSAAEQQIGHAN